MTTIINYNSIIFHYSIISIYNSIFMMLLALTLFKIEFVLTIIIVVSI